MTSYKKRMMSFPMEVRQQSVYRICGEDVIAVLKEREQLEEMTNDQVVDVIDRVSEKIEFSWDEQINAVLDELEENGEI